MTLLKTMSLIKMDLEDMRRYANRFCPAASEDLCKIIEAEKKEVDEIDSLIVSGVYLKAFMKISDHVMPRKKDFYIRRNYDYGEFWPAALDAFRDGKIDNVVDMSRKLRRWPEKEDAPVKRKNEKKLDTSSDNPDAEQKKMLNRASDESLIFLDSYCGKKKNKDYWSQMKDNDKYSEAVEDFIKYIEEVKC